MKKLVLTVGLVAMVASSTLAQGLFSFQSAAGAVWDAWSGAPSATLPRRDNTNYVAFLIGTGNSLVGETFVQNTPTNQSSVSPAAWTAILNDPNYHFATNAGTGALIVQQTSTVGGVSYLGGASVQVVGSSSAGGVAVMYAIAWSVAYGTNPFAAAAAGAPIGWSAEYNYTYAAGPNPGPAGTPGNMNGLFQFGVQPVPEPTTLALAGLGMASLLVFRRRK
jgi:hypothetical protein